MRAKKEHSGKRVIKRYRNRKLYDTVDSCYVTLEDIAELIREGEEVKIIENNTSEDITSITLAQIILEEEKRKKDVLPLGTFIHLIRSGGETIRDFVQKSLGEGVKEIHHVKDEVYDNLEKWIKRGSISHDEGNKFITSIKDFIESKVKTTVENVQNIPTVQSEVKKLKSKLDKIERELSKPKKKIRKKK
jgi:polyhydroxyalkanoate synthesis repressor PhaR